MAIGLSISGTQLYVTGLTSGHKYAFRIYYKTPGSSSYSSERKPTSGEVVVNATTYTYNFSSLLSSSGTYYFYVNVWDGTTSTNTTTSTVSYTYGMTTIRGQCGDGVKSFVMSCDATSRTVTNTAGYVYMSVGSGRTVVISNVTPIDGYASPYELYYNSKSNISSWNGPNTFTGSTMIEDTSYERRIKICATETAIYPYTQKVYIDGSYYSSASNVYNTDPSITIGNLSLYTKYSANYDFDYALVGSSTIKRNEYYTTSLSLNTNTDICLYFTSPPEPVKPAITSISTTQNSATVYWSDNGGVGGFDCYWVLYYGISTSSMTSVRLSDDSVGATVTGLSADTTYTFYIRHYVSGAYLQSDSKTAMTRSSIGYFTWTSDDATNIAAGKPVKNLTATSWNNLRAKVSACGGSVSSIPTASSGAQITAEHFNQMRNAIAGLSGSGTVASSVSSGASLKACLFANTATALKEAINRAISTKNG